LSLSVLLPLQVLRLLCDKTTIQQNLSVQLRCQTDVVVFSAIKKAGKKAHSRQAAAF
jgi:hypothetical protein